MQQSARAGQKERRQPNASARSAASESEVVCRRHARHKARRVARLRKAQALLYGARQARRSALLHGHFAAPVGACFFMLAASPVLSCPSIDSDRERQPVR